MAMMAIMMMTNTVREKGGMGWSGMLRRRHRNELNSPHVACDIVIIIAALARGLFLAFMPIIITTTSCESHSYTPIKIHFVDG